MKKSGLADSPFFSSPQKKTEATPLSAKLTVEKEKHKTLKKPKKQKTEKPTNRGTTTPSNHDTTIPWYQETIIPIVRKAVKELGKEAATHRFTLEEKRSIADIIYTYGSNGIKTSENEIARISVNFIIEDYRENGENSILHKILMALNE